MGVLENEYKGESETFWSNQKFVYLNGGIYMAKYICQNLMSCSPKTG